MTSLAALMRGHLPKGGVVIPGGREDHMEVIEIATGRVWMSVDSVTRAEYEALQETLDESLHPIGFGAAVMDAALFRHSPGGESEPVRERSIGSRRFINVAAPGERTSLPGGLVQIMVDKAHVVGFEAGRSLAILRLPQGDFVEVVGTADRDHEMTLPEGGRLEQFVLKQPWVVPLPAPTTTLWWFDGPMRSFQGPVTLPVTNRN